MLLINDSITARAVLPRKEFKYFVEPLAKSSLCDTLDVELKSQEDGVQIILHAPHGYGFLLRYALEAGPLEEWGQHFTITTH